ncbi:MAG: CheR family methyltransferase, partial [Ginsengibacter sp.]
MSKVSGNSIKILSKNTFPVVGIGASAGGLEAFKLLLNAITEDSGMAYILVQHLHPGHTSALTEILQRETTVPIHEVSDNVKVEPDNIYIIPVNKILVANDGILQLTERPGDRKNMLIDIFFSSLAEVHQDKAIGVVLSGTGTDGTAGLKKIKDHGGITIAQDESAAYEDMPQNAIRAEVVDFILAPADIPKHLRSIMQTLDRVEGDGNPMPDTKNEEQSYRRILSLLRLNFGADFNFYKQTTIRRRILRRTAILKLESLSGYHKYLQQNHEEQNILFRDLLIPVTSFFRDAKTFGNVCETVFPDLIKGKSSVNPMRIWVAGCSTGEEAYSLGIYLYEFLSDKISSVKVQIFATDISEQAIAKARSGIYTQKQLEGVSERRLHEFFTKTDGSYQIKKIIRDMCVFASHNFLKDPPFAKIDLISCRNVLIYMEPILQKKAYSIFHYALNEKGFLFLGKSETAGTASELFQPVGEKDNLYSKKANTGKFMNVASLAREETLRNRDYSIRSNESKKNDFQKSADDILLSKYTPPGVIVNEYLDIVQFRGSTGAFLEPAPGKASLNILKMARESLSFELRKALNTAKNTMKPFTKTGISLDKSKSFVSIEVIPLLNTIDLHFLILFNDYEETPVATDNGVPFKSNKRPGSSKLDDAKNTRIEQLEKDLVQTRDDMRAIAEDQETANEELQSANEELLSGSEELQSLNEELETSKEELQSTNEELITVNQELFDRNEQYNRARIYAETMVSTIHEPLLVLNADFTIRSANRSFYNIFSLTEKETLGKDLFQLQKNSWDVPGLKEYLLKSHEQNEKSLERELRHTLPSIGTRTICFNARPMKEEDGRRLILLALDDITLRKEAEKIQDFQKLKLILESMPQVTFSASADGSFTYFNHFFVEYSGMSLGQALQGGWTPLVKPEQVEDVVSAWEHSVRTLENFNIEFQLKRKSDGMYRWHLCRATAIINDAGHVLSWVGNATDIEEQKAREKAKDEFISIASHELRTPLTSAKAYLQLVETSMQQKNDPDVIYAKKANVTLNRLNNLVNELLDASKIQDGKLGLNISSFDFDVMLDEAIESVQITASKRKIARNLPIRRKISGDEDRLKQVIINLLTNAIKYSPKESKVFINAAIENNTLKVSVKDYGTGINKKNRNKIFECYYRENGPSIHGQGLGIGLFIAKQIISL